MIRVAFTLIGGKNWTGGYNYLLNLVRVLAEHAPGRVGSVLFFGADVVDEDLAPFTAVEGATVLRSADFDEARKGARLKQALLTGCDTVAARHFAAQEIDVVFEPAQFYGWRFPVPAVAWIPDFQHRYLKHLFGFGAYWKREFGFRAQVSSGRHIMLSSDDARKDCERFYPAARGRTNVVRFAVPTATDVDARAARAIADGYGLPQTFFFLPNQFWTHKNHECVIRALQLLRTRGHEVVVAVSGKQADPRDPSHFPRLMAMIESAGLQQQFRLLGLIPREHIPALMLSCAALINPSTFEGWSTTVEEAKSMGTPLLLSSLPVHREQADEIAAFFDPSSPEQLADALMSFTPLSVAERENGASVASDGSVLRTTRFADDFARLMERVVQAERLSSPNPKV